MSKGFYSYDQADRQVTALARAQAYCEDQGLIFTPIRRAVLEQLLTDNRSFGAYELIDALKATGSKIQPPSIYRALDFLTTHGLAHRVHSQNGYVACSMDHNRTDPVLLICDTCGKVAEVGSSGLTALMRNVAADGGLTVTAPVIELHGRCVDCG
ncbi:MAG: Fur family transcriptional regulator [Planktomarina sp.]